MIHFKMEISVPSINSKRESLYYTRLDENRNMYNTCTLIVILLSLCIYTYIFKVKEEEAESWLNNSTCEERIWAKAHEARRLGANIHDLKVD